MAAAGLAAAGLAAAGLAVAGLAVAGLATADLTATGLVAAGLATTGLAAGLTADDAVAVVFFGEVLFTAGITLAEATFFGAAVVVLTTCPPCSSAA